MAPALLRAHRRKEATTDGTTRNDAGSGQRGFRKREVRGRGGGDRGSHGERGSRQPRWQAQGGALRSARAATGAPLARGAVAATLRRSLRIEEKIQTGRGGSMEPQ